MSDRLSHFTLEELDRFHQAVGWHLHHAVSLANNFGHGHPSRTLHDYFKMADDFDPQTPEQFAKQFVYEFFSTLKNKGDTTGLLHKRWCADSKDPIIKCPGEVFARFFK